MNTSNSFISVKERDFLILDFDNVCQLNLELSNFVNNYFFVSCLFFHQVLIKYLITLVLKKERNNNFLILIHALCVKGNFFYVEMRIKHRSGKDRCRVDVSGLLTSLYVPQRSCKIQGVPRNMTVGEYLKMSSSINF